MLRQTQMSAKDTSVVVIDVQERLTAKIPEAAEMIRNIGFLLDAAEILKIPAQATEQYPQGLGPTVPELSRRFPTRLAKLGFSCCSNPKVVETLRTSARPNVLLTGVEAHVCVLHSALDLLALDFQVFLAVDAIASLHGFEGDREVALERLQQAGCIPVTTVTALFEWIGGADHPSFKSISGLVHERMQQMPTAGQISNGHG